MFGGFKKYIYLRSNRFRHASHRPAYQGGTFAFIYYNSIYEDNDFVEKFKLLLLKYPNVDITAMGFPKNWEEEPLWK